MLKATTIEQIATLLKLTPSDLKEKIGSDKEEDLTLPELKVFTTEELESRLRNEKATSYSEGKVAQEEMLVKQAKKDLGYEFEGKSFDAFMDHHNNKLKETYSKDSSARVKELERDITKLNETHASALGQLQEKNNGLLGQVRQMKVSNELLAAMPAETTIDKSDIVALFNLNHQIEEQEGKLIVKRNGETLKDETTAAPLAVKDVFTQYITEKNYIKGDGGRGTGSETGGAGGSGANSISEFNRKWQDSGKTLNTSEYQTAYAEFRKNNPNAVQ